MKDINKLVEKVKSNDKKAFEELYNLTASELYWYCRRLCGNDNNAKDLMQETYLNAWKKINKYTDINFKAWLHSIAHNLWLNELRNKKEEVFCEDELSEIAEDEILNPQNQAERNIRHDEIVKIIDESLNDIQRMTIMMYYYDEKSVDEIAEEMNCSESLVKVRLHRAREKLQSIIKDKNLYAISLPIILKSDAENTDFTDTLNIIRKNIIYKAAVSSIQFPCIIGVISTCAIVIGTVISDIGLPSEYKAVDNSELVAYNSSDNSETEYTQTDITEKSVSETTASETVFNSEMIDNTENQIIVSDNESVFNNIEEVNDMSKTVNTIVSGIAAVTMIATSSNVMTSADILDTMPEDVIDITRQDNISDEQFKFLKQEITIPEEMPRFDTIEDIENYFNSKGVDFGNATDEEKYEAFQYLLNSASSSAAWNDDESGAITIIWNKADIYRLGAKFDNYVRYVIHNNEAYICGSNEVCDITEYVIPDEIDGYPVAAIGGMAFSNFKNLEKITIPNTVRRIGEEAFKGCGNLKEIVLSYPDEKSDLQVIKRNAFRGTDLTEVTCFSDSDLTEIEESAFDECYELKRFDFPKNKINLGDCAFRTCKLKESSNGFGNYIIPAEFMETELEKTKDNCLIYYNEFAQNSETFDSYWYALSYASLSANLGLSPGYNRLADCQNIEFTNKNFIDLPGDIDFDGEISIKDLTLLKMYLIGETELEPMQKLSVSSDNTINNIDIRSVARLSNILVNSEN